MRALALSLTHRPGEKSHQPLVVGLAATAHGNDKPRLARRGEARGLSYTHLLAPVSTLQLSLSQGNTLGGLAGTAQLRGTPQFSRIRKWVVK
jgi:hypothetical protein